MCNQTTFYWFSAYWFRPSYPFRPLIHSALIGSDVAKQPLSFPLYNGLFHLYMVLQNL
ncbi:hypothetical protein Hanom_Chr14g01335901 [Helianthus anomalus]